MSIGGVQYRHELAPHLALARGLFFRYSPFLIRRFSFIMNYAKIYKNGC